MSLKNIQLIKLFKSERLNKLLEKIISNQFMRFCFVGGIAIIINYALFFLLFKLEVNYLTSSASGYIAGVIVGFILNKKFTFRSTSREYSIEITKYFFVYTSSLILGLGFLGLLVYFGVHVLLANVFTIALTTITNFIGCKFFVFKEIIYKKKINFLLYRYRYLIRYIIIGVGSLFVEILVIELLRKLGLSIGLGLNHDVIIWIGFLMGVLFAFILNSRINFPVPKHRNFRTFRIFLIISIFSFLLNLGLMKYFSTKSIYLGYNIMRFVSAAIIFMISYSLHRKFTFIYIKEVGVAIYLKKSESIPQIKSRIQSYPDFIHLDLVDKTYDNNAEEVDTSVAKQIKKEWPLTERMIHIMSKNPKEWIEKTYEYVNCIIFHFEVDEDISELIKLCRKYHRKVGISILQSTSVDSIIKYLDRIDIVQVFGVAQPGYSNQNLDALALEKLSILNNLKRKYNFEICFDGGVKLSNIQKINAKYIVSGSTILESSDAVKAIYDLKTSSRYYLETDKDLKEYLKEEIRRILESIDFVMSGTIVGSFINYKGLIGISDTDIVIIVDRLTKNKFDRIVSEFKKLEHIIKMDYDYDLIINTFFGPIKFNKEKTVVFHLMIYDVPRHIDHCEKSPFTCLDWQISDFFIKSPMSKTHKITTLQPNYFFNARRGVQDYLKDLSSNSISYREYNFKEDEIIEVKKFKQMGDQDKFEFSYHIMKFCMTNLLKLYYKENKRYSSNELIDRYFSLFPKNKSKYQKYFFKIKNMKESEEPIKWKRKDNKIITSFIADFHHQFDQIFNIGATHLFFIRHFKTSMNQPGIFVGQKSNPDIMKTDKNKIKVLINFLKETNIKEIYSSPLKRCTQTVEILKKELGIEKTFTNENLCEINYGLLDGKSYSELGASYPSIIKDWKEKKDPRFPEGENTNDVLIRVNNFLSSFKRERDTTYGIGNFIICTHNVFLRCLVGQQFNIPQHKWHLIEIPYVEPIELILTKEGKYYINLTTTQRNTLFKNINFGED